MQAANERMAVVLVADDEDAVRALARIFLEQAGYIVLTARDGGSALRQASECSLQIDLLVADLSMPGMGGAELARRVAELQPGVKILFVSGYSGDAVAADGMLALDAHFLEKPFTADKLARAAREALAAGQGTEATVPVCVA